MEKFETSQFPGDDELDFEGRLSRILSEAVIAVNGNAGIIALWDNKKRQFIEGAVYGLDNRAIDKLRPLLRNTISNLASKERNTGSFPTIEADLTVLATATGITTTATFIVSPSSSGLAA